MLLFQLKKWKHIVTVYVSCCFVCIYLTPLHSHCTSLVTVNQQFFLRTLTALSETNNKSNHLHGKPLMKWVTYKCPTWVRDGRRMAFDIHFIMKWSHKVSDPWISRSLLLSKFLQNLSCPPVYFCESNNEYRKISNFTFIHASMSSWVSADRTYVRLLEPGKLSMKVKPSSWSESSTVQPSKITTPVNTHHRSVDLCAS